jgi:hypothetical protein
MPALRWITCDRIACPYPRCVTDIAAAAAGHPERFEGYASWVAPTFEVDAPAPVAAGLDGESVTLDVSLVFTTRPRELRIRLPRHAMAHRRPGIAQASRGHVRRLPRGVRGSRCALWR